MAVIGLGKPKENSSIAGQHKNYSREHLFHMAALSLRGAPDFCRTGPLLWRLKLTGQTQTRNPLVLAIFLPFPITRRGKAIQHTQAPRVLSPLHPARSYPSSHRRLGIRVRPLGSSVSSPSAPVEMLQNFGSVKKRDRCQPCETVLMGD